MNYNIRRSKINDCSAIAHIVTVSWNETYKEIVDKTLLKNLKNNENERVNNSVAKFDENDNNIFVLEVDKKIVGFINIGKTNYRNYSNCGEIYALYILNSFHGKGLGKKLVEAGIQELKKLNCDKMIIGCLEGNPSNKFYEHIGGIKIEKRIFEKLQLPENVYLFENI